jgi:hypothetical protein
MPCTCARYRTVRRMGVHKLMGRQQVKHPLKHKRTNNLHNTRNYLRTLGMQAITKGLKHTRLRQQKGMCARGRERRRRGPIIQNLTRGHMSHPPVRLVGVVARVGVQCAQQPPLLTRHIHITHHKATTSTVRQLSVEQVRGRSEHTGTAPRRHITREYTETIAGGVGWGDEKEMARHTQPR